MTNQDFNNSEIKREARRNLANKLYKIGFKYMNEIYYIIDKTESGESLLNQEIERIRKEKGFITNMDKHKNKIFDLFRKKERKNLSYIETNKRLKKILKDLLKENQNLSVGEINDKLYKHLQDLYNEAKERGREIGLNQASDAIGNIK